MAKYISVLNSDMSKNYWTAVQWADSLPSVENNPYYTAGTNLNVPKHPDDVIVKTKTITESSTNSTGTATIIKPATATVEKLKLASYTASASLLKKLQL